MTETEEIERALLGAIVADNRVLDKIDSFLAPGHFADMRHARIYAAALRMALRNEPVNALTLHDHFKAAGTLVEIGGPAYLARLATSVVMVMGAESYARTIVAAHARRCDGQPPKPIEEPARMQTPWGPADTQREIAPGITHFTTASHGGYKLTEEMNNRVPLALRQASWRGLATIGWYEEDCDAAIVVAVFGPEFPDAFPAERVRAAHWILENTDSLKDAWAAVNVTWKAGMKAECPSGLGGSFDVILVEQISPGVWSVRVDMPKNPDWHGYRFPIAQAQLRTRRT